MVSFTKNTPAPDPSDASMQPRWSHAAARVQLPVPPYAYFQRHNHLTSSSGLKNVAYLSNKPPRSVGRWLPMATEADANHSAAIKADPDGDTAAQRAHKRRPHTKSRNGCTTCKRRRVKCDETRPVCRNCQHLRLECRYVTPATLSCADLQIMNLKLMHHYDRVVAKTISDAGISTEEVWAKDVVEMAFKFPFLMHAVLMFSATHLVQREPKEYCSAVVQHRSEALVLLRSEVQRINSGNLDALVATSVLLILDAMANAALPAHMIPCSLPASTWLHHVRGAATILLAVGVLPPTSKFYSFMGVEMLDLANCYAGKNDLSGIEGLSPLQCFMTELSDLYPVPFDSPYFTSLAFLDKLHHQRYRADFILRVFSFPALMDKEFVRLLAAGDEWAKRIVSAYYRLVRSYVREMHDSVWFLNGVSTVLPIDMDNQFGGLGFVTDALPISQNVDSILAKFDASFAAADRGVAETAMSSFFDDISCKQEEGTSAPPSADPSPPTAPVSAPSSLSGSPTQDAHSPPNQLPQQMGGQAGVSNDMIAPHTYGRIRKQNTTGPFQEHAPVPGSGTRNPASFVPRPRPAFRNNAYRSLGGRNRNIIRPGMMGLPVDPSIPDDLLGDFDFTNLPGDDNGLYGGCPEPPLFGNEQADKGGDFAPLQGHPFMPQPPMATRRSDSNQQRANAGGASAVAQQMQQQPMMSHQVPAQPTQPQPQQPQQPQQRRPPQSTFRPITSQLMAQDSLDMLTPDALLAGGDIPASIMPNDMAFSANSSRFSSLSPQDNPPTGNMGSHDPEYVSPPRSGVGAAAGSRSGSNQGMAYIKEEPIEPDFRNIVSFDEDLASTAFGDDLWEAA